MPLSRLAHPHYYASFFPWSCCSCVMARVHTFPLYPCEKFCPASSLPFYASLLLALARPAGVATTDCSCFAASAAFPSPLLLRLLGRWWGLP